MLFAAASSLMQSGASFGVELLSVTVGGLVLLAYTAAALVLAIAVTPRRDVM